MEEIDRMSFWQYLAQVSGWADAHSPASENVGSGMTAERFHELRAAYG